MVFLRSLAFNVFFYVHTTVMLIVMLPTPFLPTSGPLWACVRSWSRVNRWAFRAIAGVKVELRGFENLPQGGAILASKHQSTFETAALLDLFHEPTFVLKKELLKIPLFGWYAQKAEQIPVDRSAGRSALAQMTDRARREVARGRQIIIYPEGTRRPAGAEPSYTYGVAALYSRLDVPLVPIALNSGLFWPRHGFFRPPGTLVVEILPPIPPGHETEIAYGEMQAAIETASDRLIAEAMAAPNPPKLPKGGEAWLTRRGNAG
jgi:1-acyl-sn-glycerol-3-phosphate acyltransferase